MAPPGARRTPLRSHGERNGLDGLALRPFVAWNALGASIRPLWLVGGVDD
jgi:hypothetical protein